MVLMTCSIEGLGSVDLTVVDDDTPHRAIDIYWSEAKRGWCLHVIDKAARVKVNGRSVSFEEGEADLGMSSTVQLGYRELLFAAAIPSE